MAVSIETKQLLSIGIDSSLSKLSPENQDSVIQIIIWGSQSLTYRYKWSIFWQTILLAF